MAWTDSLNGDSISWLLEAENPNSRYLALRDLLDRQENDAELEEARRGAYADGGQIANVLDNMNEAGFWVRPGHGYNPKYTGTTWALLLLAQLGASISADARIKKGVNYILDHNLNKEGQFSCTGAPSGTIDCLQGNLCWALSALGCEDPRLEKAFDWMARSVTGEGISTEKTVGDNNRYFSYKCGPLFACGINNKLPCAWGGTKVLMALGNLKKEKRTDRIEKAIRQGVDFFLGVNLPAADFPTRKGDKPSRDWWKFGFPVFYITDLLQTADALVRLEVKNNLNLENTLKLIREKQDDQGRWRLEFNYPDKTWGNFGLKKEPNKWVTLRALRVLKKAAANYSSNEWVEGSGK